MRADSRTSRSRGAAAALALAAAACTGTVAGNAGAPAGGGAPGGQPGGTVAPAPPGQNPVAPASVSAAVAPMRRLTREQYRNTVRDLVGVQDAVAPSALPGDDAIVDRFHSNVLSPLQTIDVGKYGDAADAIATRAVASLPALVGCDAKAPACVRGFIESFGKRAYRRPLTMAEVELMQAVYDGGGDFATGIRLVVAAVLQSPKFLYLFEAVPTGAAGKTVGVDGWAMASRLSYFLLDTMPDQGLFAAAEAGRLATPDQIGEQASRLMADPRFRDTLATFHQDWLQLDTLPGTEKDPMLYTGWTPELKSALGEETRRFVAYVFTEGDRRLETLLSAPFSFLGGPLYAHYGVAGAGAGWQRVDLPRDQRAGLLTQAGLLATLAHDNRTSYILRGKMIREAVLCAAPLAVPPDAPAEPRLDPGASAKARSEAHRTNPACATCHELFDPLGFAFENYDAVGKWRTSDGAGPIDAKVELTHTATLDGKAAANAVELMRLLAGADEVRDCMARQWMRFALGRDDAKEDEPSLAAAIKAFKAGGAKLPDLLVALARSDAFRFQKVAE
jgi:uncharacterized protein DUF1592/uncharacterized protein DUF1588/uncharacterized protein DUF1595/uncharacterized protein DUF1585/uncharacterized protein DUF1587